MFLDINYFRTLESTNDTAAQMAKEGAPEGSVVVAEEQTAGRGRFNRAWLSGKGKGLWFSIILRPKVEAQRLSQLTIVMAVAIGETLEELYGIKPGIKWPNDLLLGGKKLSGILSEGLLEQGEIAHAIIGIGINIEPPVDIDNPVLKGVEPAYLEMATDGKVDKDELLKELLKRIKKWYQIWHKDGFDQIRTRWMENSVTIGNQVEVSNFKEVFAGKAVDIGEDGALVVEGADGQLRSFNSGEVTIKKD